MPPSFFLYARKSTDSEERQVLSIEAQFAELRLFAEKEKLTIKQEFTESQTAKVPGRPIFNEMISRIEKGEADGIIAWHPDRLARNSIDGGRVIYLLDTGHIKFLKFPTFWFENTPQGKFMMQIAFGQSKYYIDNLSENVKRGNRQKLRRGDWPGCAPLGYLNDKNTRSIVIDPVRAPLIEKLFKTCAIGTYPLTHLQEVAFEWGLVSRHKKNKNGKIAYFWIQKILTNPFYYGLMRYNGECHQGRHEPLISKELFDRVQEVLKERGKVNTKHKHPLPLLGLALCFSCGCSITAERQKGHHYYRCSKKKGKCTEPYVREEKLVEQLKAAITKVALPEDIYQMMLAALAKDHENTIQPVTELRAEMEKRIPEIKAKLDRLLDSHIDGLIDKSEFQSKKEALLKGKIDLEEKLKQLEQGATCWLEPCRDFLLAAREAHAVVSDGNLESLKETAKKSGSNFRLAAKTLQFDYRLPWRLLAAAAPNDNMCTTMDKLRTYFQGIST